MKEPKIRFKGFEGEWENPTIANTFAIRNGYTPSKAIKAFWDGGTIPWFRMEDIRENGGILKDAIQHITPLGVKGDGLFETNSIILATTATIGVHAMLIADSLANQQFTNFSIRKSLKDNYNPMFVYYSFFGIDEWCKKNTNSGGLLAVNIPYLLKQSFHTPTLPEQQSIASYFQHFDSLIQSTTKKIESLKQVKAASLQSMFPQEGETTPRVRFKGFEGEWEIVTLGEVGTFKSNGVDKLIKPNEKIINLLNYLDVYNSRQVTKDNCNSLMQVSASDRQIKECDIQKNDVFFTPSSETAEDIGYVLVMRDTLPNTCYSYHLMRYRPNEGVFFEDFPNCGFMTKFVRAQIRLLAKGVQRFVIGKTEFESIKVQIPSYKEQMQIANFFRSLDRQITLQTQRLEKLKQIKAACLDNMFV